MDRPQLIASDVDGTLLSPLERLERRTLDVIGRAQAADVPFVLASGRPPRWIPPIAAPAGLTGYAVCANGAVLYDIGADRVVSARTLDAVLLGDIATALHTALPGCQLAAERVGESARDPEVHNLIVENGFFNPWGDSESHSAPRAEVLGHPAVKLLVSLKGMRSAEMAEAASAVLDDSVDVTYSTGLGLIEVSAHGVTKAVGLAEVAERLGVDRRHTIAFGDMPNDTAMLRWAGHGVAMANAHPEVLEMADEVTAPNSEEGVAQILERWF
ncbi:HAD family hydrolase [Amycolatopsis antarctica]|uniref:HAD family hydrolase n=1 Tax=Amycolatopsis antarctica TaxID=1854586 RepID=A0A263D5B1_9PSEU|nr:HAD family hydrolase [Amycolatopsis antarctica]OZM73228.1 HAD family hydrolase [Amycolatopsis antarctica]